MGNIDLHQNVPTIIGTSTVTELIIKIQHRNNVLHKLNPLYNEYK